MQLPVMDAEKPPAGKRTFDLKTVADTLVWTPKRLRWDPDATNELTWGLTFLYALVSADWGDTEDGERVADTVCRRQA